MEIEKKLTQALSQVYAALKDDPINRSIKDVIGQMNLIELERINEKVQNHIGETHNYSHKKNHLS